jgi:hypothetical protein
MKRRSATRFSSASLDMPAISKTLPRTANPRTFKKQAPKQQPAPPTEETVKHLNSLAQEYPFCVYYKARHNDPL